MKEITVQTAANVTPTPCGRFSAAEVRTLLTNAETGNFFDPRVFGCPDGVLSRVLEQKAARRGIVPHRMSAAEKKAVLDRAKELVARVRGESAPIADSWESLRQRADKAGKQINKLEQARPEVAEWLRKNY